MAIQKWLGVRRRAGSGYYEHPRERHEAVAVRSPFRRVETYRLRYDQSRTLAE